MKFSYKIVVAAIQFALASASILASDKCGSQNGGVLCGENNPLGPCCSQYGYCGKSDSHCKPSLGCQSGCAKDDAPGYSDTNRCGTANKGLLCNPKGQFGPCCSLFGYCGTGDGYCLPSRGCQSGCSNAETGYSDNDRCGSANKGLLCNPKGEFGPCCSEYGFCGSSETHCLPANGCQSGCSKPAEPSPPTSSKPVPSTPASSAPVSTTPVSSAPASTTPASSAPASSAPASSAPASSVPASSGSSSASSSASSKPKA